MPRLAESLEQLDLLLLTVATTRRVQQDGIRFHRLRYLDLTLGGQLVDFALGDDGRSAAENLQHFEAAVLDHQLECAAEQEVADQYARRIAPDEVCRALAAPHP